MKSLTALLLVILWSAPASAYYDYVHLPQMFTTGRLVDVAWHPDGDYALIVESSGKVLKVTAADWSVTQINDFGDFYITHLDFNPDGSEALIVGRFLSGNTDEGRVYRWDHATQQISDLTACSQAGILFRGVEFTADGSSAVIIGYNSTAHIVYAYEYDPVAQTTSTGGASNFWGPCDVSWRPDGLEALISVCENDAEVIAYRPPAPWENRLLSTEYRGSNAYAVDHHPVDSYGVVVDGIGQNALKYDGVWTRVDLPSGNTMAGIGFNSDGSRALLVGRARGSTLVGTVQEFLGDRGTFTINDFRDVSIPGFGASPWVGDNNTYLNAVAFRPGLCEGLIVGGHSATGSRFAPIAHFTDIRGVDCLAAPQDGGEPDGGIEDGGDDAGVGGDDAGVGGDDASGGDDAGVSVDGDDDEDDGGMIVEDRDITDAGDDGGGDDGGGDDAGVTPADDGGAQPDESDQPACTSCNYDRDCPAGKYCSDGCCTHECVVDIDCPLGYECNERGRCVLSTTEPTDPGDGCGCDAVYRPGSSQGGTGASSGGLMLLLALAFRRRNFRVF